MNEQSTINQGIFNSQNQTRNEKLIQNELNYPQISNQQIQYIQIEKSVKCQQKQSKYDNAICTSDDTIQQSSIFLENPLHSSSYSENNDQKDTEINGFKNYEIEQIEEEGEKAIDSGKQATSEILLGKDLFQKIEKENLNQTQINESSQISNLYFQNKMNNQQGQQERNDCMNFIKKQSLMKENEIHNQFDQINQQNVLIKSNLTYFDPQQQQSQKQRDDELKNQNINQLQLQEKNSMVLLEAQSRSNDQVENIKEEKKKKFEINENLIKQIISQLTICKTIGNYGSQQRKKQQPTQDHFQNEYQKDDSEELITKQGYKINQNKYSQHNSVEQIDTNSTKSSLDSFKKLKNQKIIVYNYKKTIDEQKEDIEQISQKRRAGEIKQAFDVKKVQIIKE